MRIKRNRDDNPDLLSMAIALVIVATLCLLTYTIIDAISYFIDNL